MIEIDTIPGSTRKPGVYAEFNTRMAMRSLPGNPQRMLIIAPMSDGPAKALELHDVFSDDEAAALFGRGSLAHMMSVSALKANRYLQLQVVGLADAPAGKAATGGIGLTGPATQRGTLTLWVANTRIDAPVQAGDDAKTIATSLLDAIARKPALPVTAQMAASDNGVTLTARHGGAWGNDIRLSGRTTAPGVTVTVNAMTGGENNADVRDALAAVFAAGHQVIAVPWTDEATLRALREHLDATGDAMEKRGAVGVAGWPGTLASGTTLAGKSNDGRTTIGWHPGSVCLQAEIAAGYAAVIASEEDPARPYNGLEIVGLDVTPLTARAGRREQENALHNGLAPLEVGPGDKVQIVRAISTYTRSDNGTDDPALLDITTMRTLDYARKAWCDRIALRYPRDKATERNRRGVRSELLDVALKLEEEEVIENVMAMKDALIVDKSKEPGTFLAQIPCQVVKGLHVVAARIDLYL
ncbi:phage tail protein [Salmonella enterica]|uniref:phage tail sheath subtilisin-like domain-containing protein n=1 Tax=Salmonella enterica TaxID=28901 RepID=UPI00127048F9|nr:phage tail sheath subtilisin-like domain-containing protein [Salmonella enterica]EDB7603441.1 phage tail protein [Salmonella enterica]EEF3986154.1 phage tail protein [Salmonella enterica]EHD8421632.1 phage tail protein [Salmonella enterica]EHW0709168.1 phage tail sheath subtilisin-like domain-containing protein [Salmonella enterica]EHZ8431089.1 phage tail sheath subtilisin-like domain-containing protein [Salmonella enterica]